MESTTGLGNIEYGTPKTNQNGVLKIPEDKETKIINGDKIKRSQKLTEKGLQFKLDQLKIKREKINVKLLRKSGMVNDMLYFFSIAYAAAEEMEQVNDVLKPLTAVNDEYQHLLTDDELLKDSQWLEELRWFEVVDQVVEGSRTKLGGSGV